MNATPYSRPAFNSLTRGLLGVVRLPVVAFLLLLEPIVNVVCGVMAVLGLFAAVAFELSAVGPRFPFLQVAAIALVFGVLLILYHSAIALLVRAQSAPGPRSANYRPSANQFELASSCAALAECMLDDVSA